MMLALILTLGFDEGQAHYRGGRIAWKPVAPGSLTVEFTVTTSWVRSGGSNQYVKINADGTAGKF